MDLSIFKKVGYGEIAGMKPLREYSCYALGRNQNGGRTFGGAASMAISGNKLTFSANRRECYRYRAFTADNERVSSVDTVPSTSTVILSIRTSQYALVKK